MTVSLRLENADRLDSRSRMYLARKPVRGVPPPLTNGDENGWASFQSVGGNMNSFRRLLNLSFDAGQEARPKSDSICRTPRKKH